MEFSREKIRQIRHLMILAAVLVLAIIYSEKVFQGLAFLLGIASPFLVGGIMAFVLNIPMKAFEEKMLRRWSGKSAEKMKRPLCLVFSIIAVMLVITVVIGTVVPQVVSTATEVGKKIPAYLNWGTCSLIHLWVYQLVPRGLVFLKSMGQGSFLGKHLMRELLFSLMFLL